MTTITTIPSWVPKGRTYQSLAGHGNILGMLPNKVGDLALCIVEVEGDAVRFSQMDADGDGNCISALLTSADYIRQLDAKLAANCQ